MLSIQHYIYFAACALSCVQMSVYTHYKLKTKNAAYTISKCVGSLLFIGVSLLPFIFGFSDNYAVLILIAMVLSGAGDYFLSLPSGHHRLKIGAASFASAHLFFIAAFIYFNGFNIYALIAGAAVFLLEVLLARVGRLNCRGAGGQMAAYIFCVTMMASFACYSLFTAAMPRTAAIMTAAGGVLFLISDILWMMYGLDKNSPRKLFKALNVLTYFPAQMLIAGALLFR